MKYCIALTICCLVLYSCSIGNESIRSEITGYVYNKTTGLPEKDVKVTINLAARYSEDFPHELPPTDSLGCYYEPGRKKLSISWIVLGGEKQWSTAYCRDSIGSEYCRPVILEKEGYLPDSIYLEADNIKYIGTKSELIDTLYFSARIDPDYKAKEE